MGRFVHVALAALLAGCSGSSTLVIPRHGDEIKSILIVVDGEVHAYHPDEAWHFDAKPGSPILALYYRQPTPTGCPRTAPAAAWLSNDGQSFVATTLDASVRELLLPDAANRCGSCREFTETRVTLPALRQKLDAAVMLADGTVLGVATHVLRVSRADGETAIEGCVAPSSLFALGGDRFLAGGKSGRVSIIAIEGRTCQTISTRTASISDVSWVAGSPDGREIYTLDRRGNVYGAQGDLPLERLATLPLHPRFSFEEGTDRAAIAWMSPGEIVVTSGAQEIVFFSQGVITRRQPIDPSRPETTLTALRVIDGDIYVGDGEGGITVVPGSGDQPIVLPDNPLPESVGAIIPDRDGFIATFSSGAILQYYPSVGFCPGRHDIAGASGRGASAFLDLAGYVVLPDMVGSSDVATQVIWLSAPQN